MIALAVLALLLHAAPALAQRSLVIERLDADIEVAPGGMVTVEEVIVPRFTGSWNGIFRTIPVEYRSPHGLNYTLRLQVLSITDDENRPLEYESSRERHYRKFKIWVPGATDTTKRVRIRYRVPNALRFFETHDELYWNVTGDEWEVPIESASARVRLPENVSGVRATAFRGAYGSTEQTAVSIEAQGVSVQTERALGFREGLTIVVGWEPGVVHRPTTLERTADVVYSNLPLALPPLVFLGMLQLWRARGRDPELAPIAARYEPPDNLTPAELGTLADGTPDMRDITATMVDLAVRGYIHITESKAEYLFGLMSNTEYTFTLTKPRDSWSGLRTYERDLLGGMFASGDSVTLSQLKNRFYRNLPRLKNDLYGMLVRNGFYTARPDRVRALYLVGALVAGAVIAVAGGVIMTSLGRQPVSAIIAGVVSGLIVAIFGFFMPSRTIRGTRELEKVRGFQEFLARVEGDRMERMITTPELFERFLPYAMALGVEDNWARAFEGVAQEPPRWYTGPTGMPSFRPSRFTSSLNAMSAQAATVMASSPRGSGGSGFSGGRSGGGFGGGGGGGF
ncbi:MAG TPA: DUF2207 domain-containing protein [Vicinamibacterales bacterium]|nr:DUF2207 domain-containing protein [Vicinamibacterales bacterium]